MVSEIFQSYKKIPPGLFHLHTPPPSRSPGEMGSREGFFFLFLLVISSVYVDAARSGGVMPVDNNISGTREITGSVERNEQLCALCEEFSARAAYYLSENKTQSEIIDTLERACSQLYSFEDQCTILVDFYASLFFVEIDKIRPEEFCGKVNLCENTKQLYQPKREDICTLCHHVVEEILSKLKDPDTQFGIIQILLKECGKTGNYARECKRLVFEYGPLILANGEKFLETMDICASIHACQASRVEVGTVPIADASISDA